MGPHLRLATKIDFLPQKDNVGAIRAELDRDDSHLLPLGKLRPIHTSTHMLFSTFAKLLLLLLKPGASEASRKWVGTKIFNLRIF